MKKRKIIMGAVSLCAVICTATSCGGKKPTASNSTNVQGSEINMPKDDDPVYKSYTGELERDCVIKVVENDTAIKQGYFKELIDGFNEKYKDYGITAVDANMGEYSDLANNGPYGFGPDVIYQANDILMKYVDQQHVKPIPVQRLQCYSQIPETAWRTYASKVMNNGTDYIFGAPINIQAPLMYYRKDMLPENCDKNNNGVPDMLETWKELYNYSKEIHEKDASKYGYMCSLYDPYFSLGYILSYGGYIFGDYNTNPADIGIGKGNAKLGAQVLLQLAGIMNEGCIDESITNNGYANLANGTYFAMMRTPDVKTLFINEMVLNYKTTLGISEEEALKKANENLCTCPVPDLPVSGDLLDDTTESKKMTVMGGINGYGISSYTKYPNAALAFVDYATSYEQVMKRVDTLGIAPVRADAATKAGKLSGELFDSLADGYISIMPSISAVAQLWTPCNTFFTDLANDAYRAVGSKKYTTLDSLQEGLNNVSTSIYNGIFTLS